MVDAVVSSLPQSQIGSLEPIVNEADLHFESPGLETVPPWSVRSGTPLQVIAHIGLDGRQNWTKRGVVVDLGGSGDPDGLATGSPCVVYENGEYKMWYEGSDAPFPTSRILYANSSDGISWTKHGVVLSFGGTGEEYAVHYPWVIMDGGVYKMWYSGYDSSGPTGTWRIFYATSPDGLSWTKHGLVVDVGPSGSYDDALAYNPFVLLDGVYKMWYAGRHGANVRLMYATSTDGIGWTKQGVALDLGPPGSLEDVHVSSAYVLKEGGGYHMWYRGNDGSHNRILYATSQDGLAWTRWGLALDVGPSGSTDEVHATLQSVLHRPGMPYQMWYAGRSGAGIDRIHYA